MDQAALIEDVARRHGLSEGAVRALWDALVAGGGRQAQFSHPELGGLGQWSSGMAQIGDMFNAGLKAKVLAACADLAPAAARPPRASSEPGPQESGTHAAAQASARRDWWPAELGAPALAGSQNDTAYAVFPGRRRLAIRRDGEVALYDTGEHRIAGFSQQQGGQSSMVFTSQLGTVGLETLRRLDQPATRRADPGAREPMTGGCFCGRIRYEAGGSPFHETLCHCTDCRRVSGAPTVAWFTVARADFRWTSGEPRVLRSSGRAIRRFCPDCGTPLTFEADALPLEIDVTTASLDAPEAVPPRTHSHAASRLPWDLLDEALPVKPS